MDALFFFLIFVIFIMSQIWLFGVAPLAGAFPGVLVCSFIGSL
jgi:hypothetical protein